MITITDPKHCTWRVVSVVDEYTSIPHCTLCPLLGPQDCREHVRSSWCVLALEPLDAEASLLRGAVRNCAGNPQIAARTLGCSVGRFNAAMVAHVVAS